MRVATYNVRVDTDYDGDWAWKFRESDVLKLIDGHDWDLCGIQEVRPNQVTGLKSLSKYDCISAERDGDGSGEGLAIIYKPETFKLVEHAFFWLSLTPTEVSQHPEAAYRRICLWALLEEKETNKRFIIANVHLDHISETARLAGIRVVLNVLNPYFDKYPSIVLGDFNCEPIEAVHEEFQSKWQRGNYVNRGHIGGTFQDFDVTLPLRELVEIDYIYTQGFNVYETTILTGMTDKGRYASDHFPVETTIMIGKR